MVPASSIFADVIKRAWHPASLTMIRWRSSWIRRWPFKYQKMSIQKFKLKNKFTTNKINLYFRKRWKGNFRFYYGMLVSLPTPSSYFEYFENCFLNNPRLKLSYFYSVSLFCWYKRATLHNLLYWALATFCNITAGQKVDF